MRYTVEAIARICHEANRALQHVQQDPGVPVAAPWDEFAEQAGVIEGVTKALAGADARELHQSWCGFKTSEGWVYGPVKDAVAKTHPCLVLYDDLPEPQKDKDDLFAAVVSALAVE